MILNQYIEMFLRSVDNVSPINVVYDIGASNGQWSTAMKRQILPNAQIFMFEANPIHLETLKRTGFQFVCGTALSKPGVHEVKFYSGGSTTGDSYYRENTTWYNNPVEMTLPCMTLDNVIVRDKLPMPDFIKMDTQGSELDILDGAPLAMQQAKLIYMECPIIPYNIGAPNIGEYIEKMRVNSFVPVGLLETHYTENTLVQIDIMFMQNALKQKIAPNTDIRPLG